MFEPYTIKGVTFKNRIFSAPNSLSWLTTDHKPDDNYIRYIERKARGGAAQVTVASGNVEAEILPGLGGGYFLPYRSILPRLTELVYVIKQHNAVASLELWHEGAAYPMDKYGRNPVSASAFVRWDGQQVDEASKERLNEIADHFADYAYLAKEAGFDGVMIHGGHGWLLSQFLSPEMNHRTDEFGGSIENRVRFPLMVIDRIRERCGEDFLLEYRISGDEMSPETGGYTLKDAVEVCKMIDDKVDIIHVSAARDSTDEGAVITHPTIFLKNGCNAYLAAEIRKHELVQLQHRSLQNSCWKTGKWILLQWQEKSLQIRISLKRQKWERQRKYARAYGALTVLQGCTKQILSIAVLTPAQVMSILFPGWTQSVQRKRK